MGFVVVAHWRGPRHHAPQRLKRCVQFAVFLCETAVSLMRAEGRGRVATQIATQLFATGWQLPGSDGTSEPKSSIKSSCANTNRSIKSSCANTNRYVLGPLQRFTKPLLYH